MDESGGGATRPLVYGYIRAHLMMDESELADLKARLTSYADQEGYTIGAIFVERIDRWPAAFHALVEAVERTGARAVLVPSMHHLQVLGSPGAMKQQLENNTTAKVLIAGSKPEQPVRSRDSP